MHFCEKFEKQTEIIDRVEKHYYFTNNFFKHFSLHNTCTDIFFSFVFILILYTVMVCVVLPFLFPW